MINIRSFFIALLLSVAMTASLEAATATPQIAIGLRDIVDTVEQSFSDSNRYGDGEQFMVDLTADFVQRSIISGKQQRELRADGQLSLKNADYRQNEPLKFRFEYFRPTTHEIISDGNTLWTYLPENRQVIVSTISTFFEPRNADPSRNSGFNFLQGLPRISKDFRINFSTQGRDMDGNYILELTPVRPMESIEKLFMVVSLDSARRYVQNGRKIINPENRNNRKADLVRQSQAFPILSTTVIDHQGNSTTMEFSNVRINMRLSNLLFTFDIPADVQAVRPPGSR